MIRKTDRALIFCDDTGEARHQATGQADALRDDAAMKKLTMLDDYRVPDRSQVLHGAGFHCFKGHKERSMNSSCACGILIVLTPASDDQKPTLGRKGLSRRKTTYPVYNPSYLSPSIKPGKTKTERKLQGPTTTENLSTFSKKVSFADPEQKDPLDALRSRQVKNETRRRLAETRLSLILDKCIDNHLASKLRSMTLNTQKGIMGEDGKRAIVNSQSKDSPIDNTMPQGSSISSDKKVTSIREHENVSNADSA